MREIDQHSLEVKEKELSERMKQACEKLSTDASDIPTTGPRITDLFVWLPAADVDPVVYVRNVLDLKRIDTGNATLWLVAPSVSRISDAFDILVSTSFRYICHSCLTLYAEQTFPFEAGSLYHRAA